MSWKYFFFAGREKHTGDRGGRGFRALAPREALCLVIFAAGTTTAREQRWP